MHILSYGYVFVTKYNILWNQSTIISKLYHLAVSCSLNPESIVHNLLKAFILFSSQYIVSIRIKIDISEKYNTCKYIIVNGYTSTCIQNSHSQVNVFIAGYMYTVQHI